MQCQYLGLTLKADRKRTDVSDEGPPKCNKVALLFSYFKCKLGSVPARADNRSRGPNITNEIVGLEIIV